MGNDSRCKTSLVPYGVADDDEDKDDDDDDLDDDDNKDEDAAEAIWYNTQANE